MKSLSLRKQAGLNLIEVLIAALVLSIGMLGLAGLQLATLKTAQNTTAQQHATMLASNLLERMRSNRDAALSGEYVVTDETCASRNRSTADCKTGACTSSELADYDITEVLCGVYSAAATNNTGGISEQLLDSKLTVACGAGGCANVIDISIDWKERVEQRDRADSATQDTEEVSLELSVRL